MTDQSDTPSFDGTEEVTPEQTDTAPQWDYFDPDEEPDTEGHPDESATDDGTEEPEDDDPQDQAEDEAPAEDEEDAENTDQVFVLPSGDEVPRTELINGYLRQQDYTRKSQANAEMKSQLEQNAQRLSGMYDALIDKLSGLVPEPPDASLAMSDPGKYTALKAAHEQGMQIVSQIVEAANAPKDVTKALSDQDRAEMIRHENERLAALFPQVQEPKQRQQFFEGVSTVATDLGFSKEELAGLTDHRIYALAHYARIGMKAEQSRSKAARKAEKAPPVAPNKPGGNARANAARRNAEAMKRLSRTGSLRDALQVDFD